MTQSSRPNADHVDNGYVDAGPYTRDQWAQKLIIEWVGDDEDVRGPFYKYLNKLEVTNPAGVTIQVDTGAGYTGGTLLVNSAAVSFTPSTPAANPRVDRVVMVLNNTNAAYNTNLEFPTDLTDYEGTASVPPYSARLALLTGAEAGAPTPRALVQTSDYYMVELARYQISTVPAVSALTDYRNFIDAEEKHVFVSPYGSTNITDGTEPLDTDFVGLEMPDNKRCQIHAAWTVPADYIEDLTIYAVVSPEANGNLYSSITAYWAACGEQVNTHSGGTGYETNAVTLQYNNCVNDYSPTPDFGDIMRIWFERDSTNVLDTIGDVVKVAGFYITYFGWK